MSLSASSTKASSSKNCDSCLIMAESSSATIHVAKHMSKVSPMKLFCIVFLLKNPH